MAELGLDEIVLLKGGERRGELDPRALEDIRAAVARLALGALLWLAATAALSFPTVLYVLSLYLPSDNALNIGERAGAGLRRGVPFLLALINAVLLPALTRLLVRRGWRRDAPARDAAARSTAGGAGRGAISAPARATENAASGVPPESDSRPPEERSETP